VKMEDIKILLGLLIIIETISLLVDAGIIKDVAARAKRATRKTRRKIKRAIIKK